MANVKPRKLFGSWTAGYALDLHSTGSTYLGDDEHGHPQFDTHRSEIGELLYRLKYRADNSVIEELTEAAASFFSTWGITPTVIVPVPPTRTYRTVQPVLALAEELGNQLGIAVDASIVRKKKRYAELKNVYDAEERRKMLEGAFDVNASSIQGARVLLVDDLYRSGATMNAIAEALLAAGAAEVYVLAFTQTRSRG